MLQVTGTDRQLSSDAGILSLLSEAKGLAFVSALCRKSCMEMGLICSLLLLHLEKMLYGYWVGLICTFVAVSAASKEHGKKSQMDSTHSIIY